MGAPARFEFKCSNCTAPNVMTYGMTPRINEDRVEKVMFHNNQYIRVWRCRCTECDHSTMFNERLDGTMRAM